MAKRIALFADSTEVEDYFGATINHPGLFNARYNISPGYQLPLVYREEKLKKVKPVQWGNDDGALLSKDEAQKALTAGKAEPVISVISGFYVWKEDTDQEHPFFVRMLNAPLMAVASVYYTGPDSCFKMITSESNVLIQPMTPTMPLLLDSDLAGTWLNQSASAADILREGVPQFLLTDLSVLRVSKKINDPAKDGPELIQPIPK